MRSKNLTVLRQQTKTGSNIIYHFMTHLTKSTEISARTLCTEAVYLEFYPKWCGQKEHKNSWPTKIPATTYQGDVFAASYNYYSQMGAAQG